MLFVECAEVLAILEGLNFATEVGLGPVGVGSDAASVVSSIQAKTPPLSELNLIISDILLLLQTFSIRSFAFRPCQCNMVAHDLGINHNNYVGKVIKTALVMMSPNNFV
ncbi:hypothetical protein ACOSQ4_031142 [Xanthoceras sorbifolium]